MHRILGRHPNRLPTAELFKREESSKMVAIIMITVHTNVSNRIKSWDKTWISDR